MPANRGFDTAFGYLTGAEDYYTHSNGKSCQGLDLNAGSPDASNTTHHFVAQPQLTGTYSTYMYQAQIEAVLKAHPPGTPLFAYLPFQSVHEPIQAPDEYVDRYPSNYANGSAGRRTFAGMVSALDDTIGNTTAMLHTTGLWENLFLVFSADNGGNLGAQGNNLPLKGGKFSFWEVNFKSALLPAVLLVYATVARRCKSLTCSLTVLYMPFHGTGRNTWRCIRFRRTDSAQPPWHTERWSCSCMRLVRNFWRNRRYRSARLHHRNRLAIASWNAVQPDQIATHLDCARVTAW